MKAWSATSKNSQENTIINENNWFYKRSRNQRKDMTAHFKEDFATSKTDTPKRN